MGRPGRGGGRGGGGGGGYAEADGYANDSGGSSRRIGRNGPRQGNAESWDEVGYADQGGGWDGAGWQPAERGKGGRGARGSAAAWWDSGWDQSWEAYGNGAGSAQWTSSAGAEGSKGSSKRRGDRRAGAGADAPEGYDDADIEWWHDKKEASPHVGKSSGSGSVAAPQPSAVPLPPKVAGGAAAAAAAAPAGAELDLPIDAHRESILKHIREHRVTHIQGETGCGKSTRLPQFLLEDASSRGSVTPRIVVTQPRRMAAVTLARRVASVLGEELGAGTVGYRISGDVIDGSLCFVTVGYLLQRLVNAPEDFGKYTHVILDEVHERGVDADLLSMLVKLLMHCYPSVKLVVMSATLQANLFANYFASLSPNGRPPEVLFVGARVHPVERIFLDDISTVLDFSEGREKNLLDSALMAFSGLGKGKKGKGKGKDGDKGKGKAKGGGGGEEAVSFKRVEPQISEGLVEVCVLLVQQLAKPACTVIVFLPGIADITSLFEALAPLDESREVSGRWAGLERPTVRPGCPRLRVFALHSMIPRTEQEEVFREVPKDSCHIVLASNIAESSLTLPSVCAVVDLALRRTIQYDTRRLMCCLVTTWCSQSSCKQRVGRAGRTMPGRAVCLVPRRFFETQMPLFDPPEMLSAPLTKLYLQAKQLCSTLEASQEKVQLPPEVHMDVSAPKALLNEVVQPPSMALLEAAMSELAMVGCLTGATEDAEITPLGKVAIALPCDLRICRLLYFGCLFRCPCDAIAMAAGLTAADPFSAPSLLVLKDQREYVSKLERSFSSRRWCDNGTYSEPLMLHTLFVEWIRVGAPRGLKGLGQFAREWSVMPKKFESLACDAIDLTVRMMKLLNPRNTAKAQIEEMLAGMHHSVDKHEDLLRVSSWGRPERVFSGDTEKLRALVALAFSDQMLLHLNPKWAPNPSSKKKKQEEQILELMRKKKLDLVRSAALFVPGGQDEESMKMLCTAMCGEEPEALVYEEKSKVALVSFRPDHDQHHLGDGDALLWDVPAAIHRLHQFGSGRYRFLVELPSREEAPVELFKPLQPFLLSWEVLTHPGSGGRDKKKSKPMTVRGMCDWRNPLGYACHADDSLPATEFVGCCASIQGLEGGAQAFVAGASALPLRFLPILLGTLCPERWSVQFGVDASTGEIRGLKILHYEIDRLPAKTLAPNVLTAINSLRYRIREALTPSWDWEANDWKPPSKGRWGDLLDPPDLSSELHALMELLPLDGHAARPKKFKWRAAVSQSYEEWEEEDYVRPLRPIAEKEEKPVAPAASSASGAEREWAGLIAYLTNNGECQIGSLPQKLRKTKKQLEKRPDLFYVRMVKDGCYVSLAGGIGAGSVAVAQAVSRKGEKTQGLSKKEQQLVDAITKLLNSKKQAVGLGELGSTDKIKNLLASQKPKLQKIRPFLSAHQDIFNQYTDYSGQVVVSLHNGAGGRGGGGRATRGGASASTAPAAPAGGKGGRKGGAAANAILQGHIANLCSRSPAQAADFDGRVCTYLSNLQEKQGAARLEEKFNMLNEWLSKKAQRDEVQNWPGYIMKLLTNHGNRSS